MIDQEKFAKEMEHVHQQIADKKARVQSIVNGDESLIDEDGYPTELALEAIEKWHWDDIPGWFKFIESLWHFRKFGWKEKDEPHDWDNKIVHKYYISTGGWSGNESIIYAMQRNSMMWTLNWLQSRRGGHYIFELKEFNDD